MTTPSEKEKTVENKDYEFYLSITIEYKLQNLDIERLNKKERSLVRRAKRNLDSFHEMISNGESVAKLATYLNSLLEYVRHLIL